MDDVVIVIRCRYCRDDAFAVLQGWLHGPPDRGDDTGRRPEQAIPVCLVHRSTAVLKLASLGFPHPVEAEVGTIFPGQRSGGGDT